MTDIKKFLMPDVGEGLLEADVVAWHVKPGDTVHDGQVIVEVETAKAVVELPCPFDGVVRELLAEEGATVAVGSPIITVATGESPDGERAEALAEDLVPEAPAAAPGEGRQAVLVGYGVKTASAHRRPRRSVPTPAKPPLTPIGPIPQKTQQKTGQKTQPPGTSPEFPPPFTLTGTVSSAATVLAKPPVRKLARDLGVDLGAVVPTGPNGTVTRDDVHAAVPGETPKQSLKQAKSERGETRIPVKGVRKVTAQAMVASAFTAPHVTEWVQVDVTRTVKLAKKLRGLPEFADVKVSPLLLVAKSLIAAVRNNPAVNASWDEARQEIVLKDYVNLGIAAATPRGLVVPNIKDADQLSLAGLAQALTDLTATARAGRTQPADMSGGTVTITNVGVFGIDGGTPILNPGESAILAVGAIKTLPWVHKNKVKPRQVVTLALSFDHRLVDGELGAKVLADTAAALADPDLLIARA